MLQKETEVASYLTFVFYFYTHIQSLHNLHLNFLHGAINAAYTFFHQLISVKDLEMKSRCLWPLKHFTEFKSPLRTK